MKKRIFIFLISNFVFFQIFAQNETLEKGNKQMELNNFPAAIQTFSKALKANPNDPSVLAKLADANFKLGNLSDAESLLEKAFNNPKAEPSVALKFGKILMRNGKYEAAKIAFQKYAKTNTNEGNQFVESCDFALQNKATSSLYEVKNASIINSQYDEFGSTILNNKLVYSSGRMDMQRKASKMPVGSNQLFISDLAAGKPNSNGFFRSDLKSTYNEGPISVAENAKTVVITRNNIINGIYGLQQNGLELSLAVAELNPNGEWNQAKSFSQNAVGYSTGFACLSADGNTMIFASDRLGGQGGFDLYSSNKNAEGTWSTPVNLGDLINTSGNEITPSLDGDLLYFSSDYHQGFGGYDVYKSEKTGSEWKTIYHLGNEINSPTDDYGYIFNSKTNTGFLTSNRTGGKGGSDIYTVFKQSNEINIVVKNTDNQPIEGAKIDLSTCGELGFTTDQNGKTSFQTLAGFTCEAIISKEGYESVTTNISLEKGNHSIVLKKTVPPYTGFITDTKGVGIDNVTVKAINSANKSSVETRSLSTGEYQLVLEPKSDYNLIYSCPGYVNTQSKIKTGETGSNIGKLKMFDTAEKPIEYSQQNGVKKGVDKKGFAVQIASVTGEKIDMTPYDKIKSLGQLYATYFDEQKVSKVKLGTFSTREEAVVALAKVKEQGYVQSFIVEEGKIAIKPNVDPTKEEKKPIKETPKVFSPKPRPELVPVQSDYMVRIATLKDPSKLDRKILERIGKIQDLKMGENTVIVLTDFDNIQQAKDAQELAVKNGFKDAIVVQPVGDKLVKVKEMEK